MGVWDDKTLNASMPIEDYGLDVLKGAHIVVPLVGARRACACACVRVRRAWPGRQPKTASAPRALQTHPSDINCDILGNVTLCLLLEALRLGRPCGMRGVKVSPVIETKKNQPGKCRPLAWLVGRHAQAPARADEMTSVKGGRWRFSAALERLV